MSNKLTKEELNKLVSSSIEKMTEFIDELKSDEKDTHSCKRAGLIAYWLIEYVKMLRQEKKFDSRKLLKYNRGDIVCVNFGYRIGSELGGRHFAVVLDNYNSLNSGVITVLPLTSKKDKHDSIRSCFCYELQHGLYELHSDKLAALTDKCSTEINAILDEIETSAEEQFDALTNRIKAVNAKLSEAKILKSSLEKLKDGTIVNFGQLTTISKLRILNPKKASDSLNKIKLRPEDLDKINEQLQYLYMSKR